MADLRNHKNVKAAANHSLTLANFIQSISPKSPTASAELNIFP